jgi:hypothetical protein
MSNQEVEVKTCCPAYQCERQVTITCIVNPHQYSRVKMGTPQNCNQIDCTKKTTVKCLLNAQKISI